MNEGWEKKPTDYVDWRVSHHCWQPEFHLAVREMHRGPGINTVDNRKSHKRLCIFSSIFNCLDPFPTARSSGKLTKQFGNDEKMDRRYIHEE